MLIDVATIVSEFGSLVTVLVLVGATAVLLVVRRRTAEALLLLCGLGLIYIGVHAAKAAIDRPRPDGAHVETAPPRSRAGTRPTPRPGSRWR